MNGGRCAEAASGEGEVRREKAEERKYRSPLLLSLHLVL